MVGFQGYKDVRQIVDNLVTRGFQEQQWQPTGDGRVSQADFTVQSPPRLDKAEQFGNYTATYYTKGGMGEIYKGTGSNSEPVAIKRIPRYSLRGPRLERFLREIQVIQNISHPNIVKMLAVSQEDGYYVMEWAEHGTLEEMLKQSGTLPVEQALEIIAQIADALQAVHQQNIIHRDIKPSNILMFPENVAKLTDFGVAHVERVETLTGTGVQVGTLRYK